jgi:hypothetical protein
MVQEVKSLYHILYCHCLLKNDRFPRPWETDSRYPLEKGKIADPFHGKAGDAKIAMRFGRNVD